MPISRPTRLLVKKPVIAAISGYAVAGGLELACWCDLRVVDQSAVLGVYCRMRGTLLLPAALSQGVPLIDGGTVRLPRLIGLSRALDIILTGYDDFDLLTISGVMSLQKKLST